MKMRWNIYPVDAAVEVAIEPTLPPIPLIRRVVTCSVCEIQGIHILNVLRVVDSQLMFIFVIKYDVQKIFASAAYEVLETVASRRYTITRLLETHAQANHLTAASYLQHKLLSTNDLEVPIRIGRRVRPVQEVFAKKYGVPESELQDVLDQLSEEMGNPSLAK
jgi:hypothetical protein